MFRRGIHLADSIIRSGDDNRVADRGQRQLRALPFAIERSLGQPSPRQHPPGVQEDDAGKYGREEAAGIRNLIAGIASAHNDDNQRLERGGAVLDDLYRYFASRRATK